MGLLSYKGGNKMITFNDVDLSSLGWTTTDITRSPLPTLTINTYGAPNIMGTAFRSREIGERDFEVTLQYIGHTKADTYNKIRALVDILDTDKPQKLTISDMPGGYFYAIVSNMSLPTEILSLAKVTVKFKLCDPFFYLSSPVTTAYTATSGNVNNTQGKYNDWLIFIQVNKTLTSIGVNVGDTKFTLNGNFVAGDMIKVDSFGNVILNDVFSPHLLSLDSRLYSLAIGDNAYTITSGVQIWVKIQGKRFY